MIERLIDVVGRGAAWLTLAMVAATCATLVLRYGFDTGAIMLQESVLYMHGAVFMLGFSYTLQHDEHVRVDLAYSRMSQRRQSLVNLAGHIVLMTPLCLVLLFFSLQYVLNSWSILEGSQEVGGIQAVYLLKTLIPASACLLLLQTGLLAVREIQRLRTREGDPTHIAHG